MSTSITYLRRGEIDTARWDDCIDASPNGLIYATYTYLDHMAPLRWDALVYNDYEAVMPLTWNKKMGIYYLYQPAFTASLGVFGRSVTGEMVRQMLAAIPKKFRLIEIELNAGNVFDLSFPLRTNYILDLNKPYESLYEGYNKNLQRNLKKSEEQQLHFVPDIPVQDVIALAKKQMVQFSNYTDYDYVNFRKLFSFLHMRGQAQAYGVYTADRRALAASAVFFFSHHRAYYILVGNRTDSRTTGASHYLLDRVIHQQAGKPLLLDFEGSDIDGLANFYSSFGSVEEKYPSIRINRLSWLARLLSGKQPVKT